MTYSPNPHARPRRYSKRDRPPTPWCCNDDCVFLDDADEDGGQRWLCVWCEREYSFFAGLMPPDSARAGTPAEWVARHEINARTCTVHCADCQTLCKCADNRHGCARHRTHSTGPR